MRYNTVTVEFEMNNKIIDEIQGLIVTTYTFINQLSAHQFFLVTDEFFYIMKSEHYITA